MSQSIHSERSRFFSVIDRLNHKLKFGKPARCATEFNGISRDARLLGVSRIHLWYVLKNRRHSPSLIRRYHQLRRSR